MEPDILERIRDLHKQATTEKSHYYVGATLKECYTEISCLRLKLKMIRNLIDQEIPITKHEV